jgi:hypothetical protein
MGPELISVTLADPAGTQPLLDFINHTTDAEPFRLKFNRSYSEFDMFVFRSLAECASRQHNG